MTKIPIIAKVMVVFFSVLLSPSGFWAAVSPCGTFTIDFLKHRLQNLQRRSSGCLLRIVQQLKSFYQNEDSLNEIFLLISEKKKRFLQILAVKLIVKSTYIKFFIFFGINS